MACNYDLNRLQPYIFLFTSNTTYKVKVVSVSFQEISELNRRYAFQHQLSITIDGIDRSFTELLLNHTTIGFEDYNNVVYKINPEMSYEMSYNISYENNTLSTVYSVGIKDNTNYEVVGVDEDVTSIASTCGYSSYNIKGVYINLFDYVRATTTSVHYISGHTFEQLDYIENSLTFSSQYQFNGTTSDEISFNVDEKEYDYLPFFENKYVILIQFTDDRYIIFGTNNGLQANYETNLSSTENGTRNIKLNEIYDTGLFILFSDMSFVQLSDFSYNNIKYGNTVCSVDDGKALYILRQKTDEYGNGYDDYQCLSGYEMDYPELNITDVFELEDADTYDCEECKEQIPYIKINTNEVINFHVQGEIKEYIIDSNIDEWSLRYANGLVVTPSSGGTGTTKITIQSNLTVPQNRNFNLVAEYSGTSKTIAQMKVVQKPLEEVFPEGDAYIFTYKQQISHIPTNVDIISIDSSYVSGNIWYENNNINIELFHNESAVFHHYITATTIYGEYILEFTQQMLYTDWRYMGEDGCDANGDLCEIEVKYVSVDNVNFAPTQTTRYGSVIQSGYCDTKSIRIVDSNRSYCDGSARYKIMETQETTDGWQTYSVTNETLGDYIEPCSANLTYSWSLTTKEADWGERKIYLYLKIYFNTETHASGAVIPWLYSPDGNGNKPIRYVDE